MLHLRFNRGARAFMPVGAHLLADVLGRYAAPSLILLAIYLAWVGYAIWGMMSDARREALAGWLRRKRRS